MPLFILTYFVEEMRIPKILDIFFIPRIGIIFDLILLILVFQCFKTVLYSYSKTDRHSSYCSISSLVNLWRNFLRKSTGRHLFLSYQTILTM